MWHAKLLRPACGAQGRGGQRRFQTMQKNPGRRTAVEQRCRLALWDASATERLRRDAAGRTKAWTEPIDHSDGNQFRNAAPLLPAVEGAQIVSSHDPDKTDAWAVRYQISDDVMGITHADLGFYAGNLHARTAGESAGCGDPLIERSKPPRVLEGISWRDQPPHLIEFKSLQCQQAGSKVRLMRGIEGSTEQPDSLARVMDRNPVPRRCR